jgi:hypothetical protein
MKFVEFPKIARLNREVIVTEKIDGTNAQVTIVRADLDGCCDECKAGTSDCDVNPLKAFAYTASIIHDGVLYRIYAGSRSRWIRPGDDNFGFAAWVSDNAEELVKLGEGSHFGEWWGKGIQRGYGLLEKRFSLFNVSRWADPATRPKCCHVVPELGRGIIGHGIELSTIRERLATLGSSAAPGFMKPEGFVVYHTAAQTLFKVTLEKDEKPKGSKE